MWNRNWKEPYLCIISVLLLYLLEKQTAIFLSFRDYYLDLLTAACKNDILKEIANFYFYGFELEDQNSALPIIPLPRREGIELKRQSWLEKETIEKL